MLLVKVFKTIKCQCRDIQRISTTVTTVDGILIHMFLKFVEIETSGIGHDSLHLIEYNALERDRRGRITGIDMLQSPALLSKIQFS